MKILPTGLLAAALLLVACSKEPAKNPDPNHTHADFAVWIEGKQFDFSQPQYMSETPKKDASGKVLVDKDGAPVMTEIPGRKYQHLHDGNGHVTHRHKPGLTFADFFKTIGFTLTDTCFTTDTGESTCNSDQKKWQMFVNGKEIPMKAAYDFTDLDKILITYAANNAEIQKELAAMTDQACEYSKTCPEHGEPPTENCIADPSVPCVAP